MGLVRRLLILQPWLICALYAKTGAPADEQPTRGIALAIRHSLEYDHFAGGSVQELLLADPESGGSTAIYLGEFAIKRSGRLIRCEDWRFTVHRARDGWAVLKTERGRCND